MTVGASNYIFILDLTPYRPLHEETRDIEVLGLGAIYIKGLTVVSLLTPFKQNM